jgi:hypothetical protein
MSDEGFDSEDDFMEDGFGGESFMEQLLSFKPSILDPANDGDGIFNSLNDIAQFVKQAYGDSGMYTLMCAIEAQTGWSLEIIAAKGDLEQVLWDDYGVFDESAWLKARNSQYWDMMVRDIYTVSNVWNRYIIASIAGKPVPFSIRMKHAWRVLTRRF